jgi:hypothetical protein
MNINGAFPSDFLKASDLNGRPYKMSMGRVTLEKVGDDERPVLHFQAADKGLVLNKTNANTIAAIFGEETDGWFGHPIEVYPSETDYQGKRVACIRVRAVQAQQSAPPPVVSAPPPDFDGDDQIPF